MGRKVKEGDMEDKKVKRSAREYLTVNEAASLYRVSRRTVLSWIKDGLPCFRVRRVFRILLANLEAWGARR